MEQMQVPFSQKRLWFFLMLSSCYNIWGTKIGLVLLSPSWARVSHHRKLNVLWMAKHRYRRLECWLSSFTAPVFPLNSGFLSCELQGQACSFQQVWSRADFYISSSTSSCIHFSCPSLFQRTAHLHNQSTCLPNWPQHQEELGSCKQAGCNCFLLLWQHKKQLSDYQCGWSQGRRLTDTSGMFYWLERIIWCCSSLAGDGYVWACLQT